LSADTSIAKVASAILEREAQLVNGAGVAAPVRPARNVSSRLAEWKTAKRDVTAQRLLRSDTGNVVQPVPPSISVAGNYRKAGPLALDGFARN